CDGGGACLANLEPNGFPCGDPASTQCDNPDTCNGTGTCLTNFETAGLACGDPSSTDCDNPDICDGSGGCDVNHQPDGLTCTDEGLDCTFDECGGGTCLHPPILAGTPCGEGSNTQCDNPDTCDGAGECLDNFETIGSACGDPTETDCDNADTCDGAGSCLTNFEPPGTVCTDDGNDCTRDTCSRGTCTHRPWDSGTPCGDATDVPCDGADTCDGSGSCLDNVLPDDAPCPNGDFCDGAELCLGGVCQSADPPCDIEDDLCDEQDDECDLLGDFDGDLLVTQSDFSHWPDCETGPVGGPFAIGCEIFDFEQNGFVDLRDYARFLIAFTMP
ncbi:MAG: hypothetical protein IIC02_05750, partial [Planctomycetes bacterium]|nr:hypothetical protein [Planctomycetota bacterium]